MSSPSTSSLLQPSDHIRLLYYIKRLATPTVQSSLPRPVPPKLVHHRLLYILNTIRKLEIEIPPRIYTSLIDAFTKTGDMEKAEFLFKEFIEKGHKPDVYLFNSMMYGYVRTMKIENVLKWFDKMVLEFGVPPNTFTYNQVMKMHDINGDMDALLKVWNILKSNRSRNENHENIRSTSRISSVSESTAPAVNDASGEKFVDTYSSQSNGNSQHLSKTDVVNSLSELIRDYNPEKTKTRAISSSPAAVPDNQSFVILVTAMGRNKRPLDAVKFFREFLEDDSCSRVSSADTTQTPKKFIRRPTTALVNALLFALTKSNHMQAAELLFTNTAKSFRRRPNTFAYNLMIQMYIRNNEFENAWRLLDEMRMQEEKLKPPKLIVPPPELAATESPVETDSNKPLNSFSHDSDNSNIIPPLTLSESFARSSSPSSSSESINPSSPLSNSSTPSPSNDPTSPSSTGYPPVFKGPRVSVGGGRRISTVGINFITLASLYNAAALSKNRSYEKLSRKIRGWYNLKFRKIWRS
ncbi:hypothetical protein BKA69DRAFT_1036165 [Paraphysoderma sedebokerense]|nr:hypothetical protein BKA69DRAFT_1036165 [Paraphysoderma sedebokerense]